MRRFFARVGLALAVAGVAILCLSSAHLAAAIGIMTAAIVAIDSLVFRPPQPRPPHDQINVDPSRRR